MRRDTGMGFENVAGSEAEIERLRICDMLELSQQSTPEEIEVAYRSQCEFLSGVIPKNRVEEDLLTAKKNALTRVYEDYKSHANEQHASLIVQRAYKRTQNAHAHRAYSFNIPCVIWLGFQVTNCAFNTCCAGCDCLNPCGVESGGCGQKDIIIECYNENLGCLRPVDTVIAIIIAIAAAVAGIKKLNHNAEVRKRKRDEEERRRQEEETRRRIANEKAEDDRNFKKYKDDVKKLHHLWEQLYRYRIDILPFLKSIGEVRSDQSTNDQFAEMMHHIRDELMDLKSQWQEFIKQRDALIRSNYYRRLIEETSYYNTMFSDSAEIIDKVIDDEWT